MIRANTFFNYTPNFALFIGMVALLGGYFLWVLSLSTSAHEGLIVLCGKTSTGEKVEVVLLKEVILENGLIAEAYDRNGDGVMDIVAYSSPLSPPRRIPHGRESEEVTPWQHHLYPIFYEVDTDLDGYPDKLYVDKYGDGRCEGIVEMDDYNAPGDHKSPSERSFRWLVE